MGLKNAVFTVGVISYKNSSFLYDALESVFLQDYPEIELVISDDGSGELEEEKLISFLNDHRTENIKRVVLNNSERNIGTCKQMNNIRSMTEGQYLLYLAADDVLDNPSVLSGLATAFHGNNDPFAVCGNCGLYDGNLRERTSAIPDEAEKEKLHSFAPDELYRALSTGMFIPAAATAYNMKAFDVLGPFDERIFLLEDWAFFLKMARSGYKPFYADIDVVRHRSGGLAYGYEPQLPNSKKRYDSDEIAVMELEMLPYRKRLGRSVYARVKQRHRFLKRLWYEQTQWFGASRKEKLAFFLGDLTESFSKALSVRRHKLVAWCAQRKYIGSAVWTAAFALLYSNDYSSLLGSSFETKLHEFFGIMSLIMLAVSLPGILIKYLYKIYIPLKLYWARGNRQ